MLLKLASLILIIAGSVLLGMNLVQGKDMIAVGVSALVILIGVVLNVAGKQKIKPLEK